MNKVIRWLVVGAALLILPTVGLARGSGSGGGSAGSSAAAGTGGSGMISTERLHEQTPKMDQARDRVRLFDAECEQLELRYRERTQKIEQQYLKQRERDREQAELEYQNNLEQLERERRRERERLRVEYGIDNSK